MHGGRQVRIDDTMVDRIAIRELVDNWALWRDGRDWERFATVWHDDGVMLATWFQGRAATSTEQAAGRLVKEELRSPMAETTDKGRILVI